MIRNKWIIPALLAINLYGCNSVAGFYENKLASLKEPEVSLTKITLKSASLTDQDFLVNLDIKNQNEGNLEINGIDLDLFLNNQFMARGQTNAPVTLQKGNNKVAILAHTKGAELINQLLDIVQKNKPSAEYQVKGNIRMLPGVFSWISMPINYSGTIPIKELLKNAPILLPQLKFH